MNHSESEPVILPAEIEIKAKKPRGRPRVNPPKPKYGKVGRPRNLENPSQKLWSERTKTYYYLTKRDDYYREYYNEHKIEFTCEHCGKYIIGLECKIKRHNDTKRCKLIQLRKQVEYYENNLIPVITEEN